jgi:hypothetical protein
MLVSACRDGTAASDAAFGCNWRPGPATSVQQARWCCRASPQSPPCAHELVGTIARSITTTSQYIEIDMAMKREALARCAPPVPPPSGESPWHARQDIVQWLEDL